MRKVPQEELNDEFPAPEGELHLVYGRIGSGKSYKIVCDIIDELALGLVVYVTLPIAVADYDGRDSFLRIFWNTITFKKRFYKIPRHRNLHYINAETGEVDGIKTFDPSRNADYITYLNSLSHCSLYIDECWRIFDSYQGTNFSLATRNLILVTRHKFRKIVMVAQRPTSIQVTARANVNRFFKCVKIGTWPVPRFASYEFQDMTGETVDETQEPLSIKRYWGRRAIFAAYNSFYYGSDPIHIAELEAWDYSFKEKLGLYFFWFRRVYTKLLHKLRNVKNSNEGVS